MGRHGLDAATLERLASSRGWQDLGRAEILDKLGVDVDISASYDRGVLRHLVRVLVATGVFLATAWCVVGGIWEGHSALFGTQRLAAFATLALLLLALGVFEGLQVSVALLRFKDIEHFAPTHRRAARLHRLFKSESGTRRFLAGRQFFVVFVVFFIARITAFPDVRHVPVLGTPLPGALEPLWFGLFDLGLLGALLVLWAAQLAPQFGANRDPLAYLELPGMGPALRASFTVDDTGVTLPGFWFSSWVRERERIPTSRAERFRQARKEGIGAVTNLVRRHITVGPETTVVHAEKRFLLAKGGFDAFDDESLTVVASRVDPPAYDFVLQRAGRVVETRSRVRSQRLDGDGATAFSFELSPRAGTFEADDAVMLTADVACSGLHRHAVEIDEPTRLVHVVIEIAPVGPETAVTVQRYDAHLADPGPAQGLDLQRVGDRAVAEYFCVFPRPGEVLRFVWRPAVSAPPAVEAAAAGLGP